MKVTSVSGSFYAKRAAKQDCKLPSLVRDL